MALFDQLPQLRLSDQGRIEWPCPRTGCLGVMDDTGEYLLVGGGGYVHQCDVCNQKLWPKGARFNLPRDD